MGGMDENAQAMAGTLPADPSEGTELVSSPYDVRTEEEDGWIPESGTETAAAQDRGVTAERSDVRNAERLVELHGKDLRFVGAWAKWLVWDGRRWAVDEASAVQELAVQTVRILFRESLAELTTATQRGDESAIGRAKANVAWSIKSQGAARVVAMVGLARSKRTIAVRHVDLDADNMLLNLVNGTVDLRTGEIREHRRDDLITKLAPVVFDENAKAATWEVFLDRAMGGDARLVAYLQKLAGYGLTGDIREHVLAFFFGAGANGKSTFLSTMHAMLGDYASPAPRGLLFRSRGEHHPTELASLHGRRFVTCSEIEDGLAFDEALTKDLTGGDPIECRRMREDFWSFLPTHKLFMAGNHKPTVRGDDEGIWRRMRLVPWTITIPANEQDKRLLEKLRAELPGILAWAIRGCLAWQADGLSAPPAVVDATKAYRDENDAVGEFFRLTVIFEPGATIARKELRESYETFCKDNGAEPFGAKRFAARLREHGVTETTIRRGTSVAHGWKGVRLANDAERAAASVWAGRSHVATCSQQLPYQSQTPAHEATNRESVSTTGYVDTEADFADDLEAMGVRRPK